MQIPDTLTTHLDRLRSIGAEQLADDITRCIEEAPDPTPVLSADDIVKVIEAEASAEVKVERARAARDAAAGAVEVEQLDTMIEADAERVDAVIEADAEQLAAVIEADAEQLAAVIEADAVDDDPEPLPDPAADGEAPTDTHWLLRSRGRRN